MKSAWVRSGALRAPLCIQGHVMAHVSGRREIGVKFRMRAASVDPKNTQHTHLIITTTKDTRTTGGASEKASQFVLGVFVGSTEAALIGNSTPISRRPAKCVMTIAWVHSGALRATMYPRRCHGTFYGPA